MIKPGDLSIEISEQYDFSKDSFSRIEQNPWVKHQWPLVYFIENSKEKLAYVGESTNALVRIKSHLANPERRCLNRISIIGSDKFNKSATLDIESNLIQYIVAEGTYKLQNANYGLLNHNYYQKDLYKDLFREVWNRLIEKHYVSKSLAEIENSELFKYSPYKSLNKDQYSSVLEILEALTTKENSKVFIGGSAGTGKTILATYLIKLLHTKIDNLNPDDLRPEELVEVNYIRRFQAEYRNAKIGLVIAMTSLRETIENIFRRIPGLKPSMVLSPSDTFKLGEKYDLLIVDEAHRLRQYKNISWMGAFKKNNERLGLDDTGTELDWILKNSKNQILFYDPAQSVKPSDVDPEKFEALLKEKNTISLTLKSQMRVKGGNDYIQFVDELLSVARESSEKFEQDNYDLFVFDSFKELHSELEGKEKTHGLCRMIAGYSWPWLSDIRKNPDPETYDIQLDDMKFKWNATMEDWINSPNAFHEIGCIHTTQGYDLNYAAVIFGKEIDYNKETGSIEIDPKQYFDIYGKKGINDSKQLKAYIINIYKTIMYRGIRGTFVYAVNEGMKEYLKENIPVFNAKRPFRILRFEDVIPYVNSIPLIDIKAAAGNFSDLQQHSELTWIEPPFNVSARKGYFICQITGESMNKKIPNGSFCLFRKDEGGSREGKIVLVQSTNIQDSEFGSGYTVKEYHSDKFLSGDGAWKHESIVLKPLSDSNEYTDIVLSADELIDFKVIGIFEKVLSLD